MFAKLKKDTYFFILFFYVLIMVLDESNYKYNSYYNVLALIGKLVIFCLILVYIKKFNTINIKHDMFMFSLIILNALSMFKNGLEINMILFLLMILASKKMPLYTVFKVFLLSFLIGVCFIFLSSFIGFIPDTINVRYSDDFLTLFILHTNRYERHSFGFQFSNQVPFVLMTIYFLFIALRQQKMKMKEHVIFEILNLIVFILCGSRFVLIIMIMANICYIFYKNMYKYFLKEQFCFLRKKIAFIIRNIFIIGTVFSFACVLFNAYVPTKFDSILNFRLTYAFEAIKYYGIYLFGSGFDAGTAQGAIKVIVDNGYIMLFMQRGILFAILLLVYWSQIIRILLKKNNFYLIISILMIALENFVDYQILSYHFLPFMCIFLHKEDRLLSLKLVTRKGVKNYGEYYKNVY